MWGFEENKREKEEREKLEDNRREKIVSNIFSEKWVWTWELHWIHFLDEYAREKVTKRCDIIPKNIEICCALINKN